MTFYSILRNKSYRTKKKRFTNVFSPYWIEKYKVNANASLVTSCKYSCSKEVKSNDETFVKVNVLRLLKSKKLFLANVCRVYTIQCCVDRFCSFAHNLCFCQNYTCTRSYFEIELISPYFRLNLNSFRW